MVRKVMTPVKAVDRALSKNLQTVFWCVVIAWAVYLAPQIDLFFRPIVVGFKIDFSKSYRSGDSIFMFGEMKLDRKGVEGISAEARALEDRCEYQGVAIRDQRGQKLAFWLFSSDERPESTDRLNGPQPWGPWKIAIGLPGNVTHTSATVAHRCRWVWPFDTPAISSDAQGASALRWERRVQTWLAESSLWDRLPVGSVKSRPTLELEK